MQRLLIAAVILLPLFTLPAGASYLMLNGGGYLMLNGSSAHVLLNGGGAMALNQGGDLSCAAC